jgi:hypothetical protein
MPGALLEHEASSIKIRIRSEQPARRHEAWLFSFGFALLGLVIHGYHPFSEDAAVYIPAVKRQLDHSMYAGGSDFFLAPARLSVFSGWVALSARLVHLPLTYVLLGWYLTALTVFLAACWKICMLCFQDRSFALFGTASITALLTLPVANSSLLISDPYLTSRSLSTPVLLWCVYFALNKRYGVGLLFLFVAVLLHPLMALFGAAFLITLVAVQERRWRWLIILAFVAIATISTLLALGCRFAINPSYRAALLTRPYFFLSTWKWYELAGVIIPLAIFAFLGLSKQVRSPKLRDCALAISLYGTFFFLLAFMIDRVPAMAAFAKFQPMRSFHLIYILLFLLAVNLVLTTLLRQKPAVLLVLLAIVTLTMFSIQRRSFPASAHIEAPWELSNDPWREGFDWVRSNTPKDARFALDADYMDQRGEGRVGFRAYAERDALADRIKDGGVAALFPFLASRWKTESQASGDIQNQEALRRLGATWVLTARRPANLSCPFTNSALAVCILNPEAKVGKLDARAKAGKE